MTEFVSTKEAARRLGVTVQHVRLLARSGQISAKQDLNGRWLFAAEGLPAEPRRAPRHHAPRDTATAAAAAGSGGSQDELVTVDRGRLSVVPPVQADGAKVTELEREVTRLREENATLRRKLEQAKAFSELLGTASRLVDMLE